MTKTQRKQIKQAAAPAPVPAPPPLIRTFASGATRDTDSAKPDYAGFTDPLVLERFGEYMNKHRTLPDGSMRGSSNWKLGIPQEDLFISAFRHFHDWDMWRSGYQGRETEEDAICAVIFNANAYLRGLLRARGYHKGDV